MSDHRFRVKYDWLPSSLCCMFECLGVYPWVGVLLVCECTCVWGVLAHVHTCALCVEARGWYWLSSSLALHLICRHGLLLNPELTDSASLLIQISRGWGGTGLLFPLLQFWDCNGRSNPPVIVCLFNASLFRVPASYFSSTRVFPLWGRCSLSILKESRIKIQKKRENYAYIYTQILIKT